VSREFPSPAWELPFPLPSPVPFPFLFPLPADVGVGAGVAGAEVVGVDVPADVAQPVEPGWHKLSL
jgi:hypothetical protein